jgi:hydroxymethylglutaryl-CoA lyase
MTGSLIIHEVGLRDGLQMEHQTVPLERKTQWVEALVASGVDLVQLGSFVHPEKVPQMADTDRLFRQVQERGKPEGVIFSGLVLNEKGLERGMACGVDMFCMGVSASETHSRKNTGMSIAEATDRIVAIARNALTAGKKVQVSVQSAFGCGYEGPVPEERVMKIVERYLAAGLKNISLADTAGHATPAQVDRLYRALLESDDDIVLACHFHNTYGMALANCYAAMNAGVTYFESSVAGLGGCPFTKIAGGNVSTEDLVHMLHRMGLRSDLHLDRLIAVARDVAAFFNREMPGTVYRTGPIPEPAAR